MDDMIGIARSVPTISEAAAARLERALAATDLAKADIGLQRDLLAKRDALLALAGERA
jgi:beta-N-acetylhexosaminidase